MLETTYNHNNMMAFLTSLRERYHRFLNRQRQREWDNDLKVLLKRLDDPFNFEGLELALLHLKKNPPKEPTLQQRRNARVLVSTRTVDQLLVILSRARLYVIGRDTMPRNFIPSEEARVVRFDDYFVSDTGHVVSIEKIYLSLEGWITQLISTLRELEIEEPTQYAYYNRKLRNAYSDAFYVLQALLQTRFH